MTVPEMLSLNNKITQKTSFLITDSTLVVSLCVNLATPTTIRKRLRNKILQLKLITGKLSNRNENVKLSETLFVVIGLSFAFWLPAITMYTVMALCVERASEILLRITTVLLFANSLVNPIVYSYRMPMFKAAMKKLFKSTAN